MENRKKPASPVHEESPTKSKGDDFEPKEISKPQPVDSPTSPPQAYDCTKNPPGVTRE